MPTYESGDSLVSSWLNLVLRVQPIQNLHIFTKFICTTKAPYFNDVFETILEYNTIYNPYLQFTLWDSKRKKLGDMYVSIKTVYW